MSRASTCDALRDLVWLDQMVVPVYFNDLRSTPVDAHDRQCLLPYDCPWQGYRLDRPPARAISIWERRISYAC